MHPWPFSLTFSLAFMRQIWSLREEGGWEVVNVTLKNDRMLQVMFTHILPMIPPAALCICVFSFSLMLLSPAELPGFKLSQAAPTDAAAFADLPR